MIMPLAMRTTPRSRVRTATNKGRNRDEFTLAVIRHLAAEVGHVC